MNLFEHIKLKIREIKANKKLIKLQNLYLSPKGKSMLVYFQKKLNNNLLENEINEHYEDLLQRIIDNTTLKIKNNNQKFNYTKKEIEECALYTFLEILSKNGE